MTDIDALVREFHQAFNLPTRHTPTRISEDEADLRDALLHEEVDETLTASLKGDLIGIADGLADVVYVAFGTALAYGIDLNAVLAEVHRSNMTKLGEDGRPIYREDGKVMKGPGYTPPDIPAVLGLTDA